MRYCDARMTVGRLHSFIDCSVSGHPDRRVVITFCSRPWNWSNAPGNAIILGYDRGLHTICMPYRVGGSTARVVRHIYCSVVWGDFDMAMQPAAVSSSIHRRSSLTEKEAAIVAPKRARFRHAL